jgi:hypothetical protein
VNLKGAMMETDNKIKREHALHIESLDKNHYSIAADDKDDLEEWVNKQT